MHNPSTTPAHGFLARWRVHWSQKPGGQQPGEDFQQKFERIVGNVENMGREGGGHFKFRVGWLLIPIGLLLLFRCFVIVPYGEAGVVFSAISGVQEEALGEGFHLIVPFVQSVQTYDVKVQTYTMTKKKDQGAVSGEDQLQALTSDGQRIDLDVTIQYRPPQSELARLHDEIGDRYRTKIVRPYARSVVRMVCAQHPVADYTSERRNDIESEIEEMLTERYAASHISLEDVIIDEVEFSDEFKAAVEEKQRALQEAEQMEYQIREALGEAERVVVDAEGDAESIIERGTALERNPMLLRYEYVQKVAPNVGGIITSAAEMEKVFSASGDSAMALPKPDVDLSFDDLDLDFKIDSNVTLPELPSDLVESDEKADPVTPADSATATEEEEAAE